MSATVFSGWPNTTIWDSFCAAARRFPDKVAVVLPEPGSARAWSYRELLEASRSAAASFANHGVRCDDMIAVISDRELETIAAFLGAMAIGASYIPIDPRFPRDRIGFILNDSQPALMVTDRDLGLDWRGKQYRLFRGCFSKPTKSFTEASADPERLAYVMYTSGSTGVPKGVVIPHRGAIRLLFAASYYEFSHERNWLQLSPLTFDASILDLWGGLLHGGKCVLFPGHGVPDLDVLRGVIRDHGITSLWLTTSLFNTVVSADASALSGVNTIFVGGEALSVPHIRIAQEKLVGTDLINGYGPTENSTFTTCFRIPNPMPVDWTSVPIGSAIEGTSLYILDESGQPVERGRVGELYVGGHGVAVGYLNKPELTAERFLPDPFIGIADRLMYRTGDLVSDLGNGLIRYLGRNDTQIKLRGNRIELGEIENVMLTHHAVTDACARIKTDGNGERHLIAYYLADGVDVDGLPELLAAKLPAAVVPKHVLRLAYMPLTENGKLDESRLPNPFDTCTTERGGMYQSLMDAGIQWESVHELIEAVWRMVLPPGSRFSRADSFFEVGGTSVGTLQIAAKLSRELRRPVRVTKLFEYPSIDRLAQFLTGREESERSGPGESRAVLARKARERRHRERSST